MSDEMPECVKRWRGELGLAVMSAPQWEDMHEASPCAAEVLSWIYETDVVPLVHPEDTKPAPAIIAASSTSDAEDISRHIDEVREYGGSAIDALDRATVLDRADLLALCDEWEYMARHRARHRTRINGAGCATQLRALLTKEKTPTQ